jgi:hypothetical protein
VASLPVDASATLEAENNVVSFWVIFVRYYSLFFLLIFAQFHMSLLIQRHARSLLSKQRLRSLARFAKGFDLSLPSFFKKERQVITIKNTKHRF